MITITGSTVEKGTSTSPLSGVMVSAYQNSDENTALATASSDTAGNFTLTITTNGHPLDGFLKATVSGHWDTYLYPPVALTADYSGATMNMVTDSTVSLLSGTLCRHAIDNTKGVIAVEVVDAAMMPVAGASVASNPVAADYCYNATNGFPDSTLMMTTTSGIGYMLDVSGPATVSATKSGTTFASHPVKARVGTVTTTLIVAQ
ncbi:MAG: hypothetical protein ABJE66_31985 [Deltaproteobacteria bacterium]